MPCCRICPPSPSACKRLDHAGGPATGYFNKKSEFKGGKKATCRFIGAIVRYETKSELRRFFCAVFSLLAAASLFAGPPVNCPPHVAAAFFFC